MANVKILEFLSDNNIDFRMEKGSIYINEGHNGVELFESDGEYTIRSLPKKPCDITETLYRSSFKDFDEFKDIILKWYPFSKWDAGILPFNLIKEDAYKSHDFGVDYILSIFKKCIEVYIANISLEIIPEGNKKYYHIKVDSVITDIYFIIYK